MNTPAARRCRSCSLELHDAATTDMCDDCAEPAPSRPPAPAPPPLRPVTVDSANSRRPGVAHLRLNR
ncbi:hypothetical protein FK529_04665 [Tsukamurella asaccharolytica]|uniref:Uncharacterized protein n=1 Tax=Tsukamurella asaccharolytica TaxID=2592067 RepID=A0A5C5RC91_9ACTN|nr:hypothetical protein [Tsukamurella asaccharolytica]TWS20639.1 hypothetical protein FK529_04665 [Tsukamurella asaccharolytica]